MLDEVHFWVAWLVEMDLCTKVVIGIDVRYLATAALHTLEQHEVARDMLVNEVKGEQRMAQMVEHCQFGSQSQFGSRCQAGIRCHQERIGRNEVPR